MRSNRLQLNALKIEILWSVTSCRLHRLPQLLLVSTDFVTPSAAVWDLWILFDSDLPTSSHIRNTVSTCFAVLRQLHSLRRSVSRPVVKYWWCHLSSVIWTKVARQLAGMPQHLHQLQSVMNAAARLLYSSSKFDHITPLLHQLHMFKAKEQIDFKLALMFKCVHGSAPPYLADELSWHRHLYWSSIELTVQSWVIGLFCSLRHAYGTIFHITSSHHIIFEFLKPS